MNLNQKVDRIVTGNDGLDATALALEGRIPEVVDSWSHRLRQLGASNGDGLHSQDLTDRIAVVVSWVVRSMRDHHPVLDASAAGAVRAIAARWREEGRKVEESLLRFAVLSHVMHEELQADLVAGNGWVDAGVATRASERLGQAIMLAQLSVAEAYREAEEIRFNRFASTLVHEVRSPLAAAMTAMETFRLLEERGELEPGDGRTRILGRVERNIWQATEVVQAVESLARPGPEDEPRELLSSVISRVFENLAQEAGSVDLAFQGTMPAIMVPGEAVALVLQNLVRNAIAYADPSKPTQRVRITCERDDDTARWLLRVSDNGIGIAPAEQEVIFERFRRGSEAPGSGLGLGLSIVKTAVAQVGGGVVLESEPGRGSTFTIALPFDTVRSAPEGNGKESHRTADAPR